MTWSIPSPQCGQSPLSTEATDTGPTRSANTVQPLGPGNLASAAVSSVSPSDVGWSLDSGLPCGYLIPAWQRGSCRPLAPSRSCGSLGCGERGPWSPGS